MKRRVFIKASAVVGGGFCIPALEGCFGEAKYNKKTLRLLQNNIEGEVLSKVDILQQFAQDYGTVKNLPPAFVVLPKNIDDIKKTLLLAKQLKLPVKVRGEGHSFFGQSLLEDGIIIRSETQERSVEYKNETLTISGG